LIIPVRDNDAVTPTDDAAAESSAPPRPAPGRPRRVALFAVVAVAVVALDVASKVLVVAKLEHHPPKRLLGGAIYLDVARNSGAAFSLGTGFTVLLSLIALAVIAVIVRTASRMRSTGWAMALGLILGGAIGNLADRIFREPGVFRGHVVDWISLFGPDAAHWPIFNLADSAIVCGAILAALLSLFGVPLDGGARDRG
jgi:signal peptidase II